MRAPLKMEIGLGVAGEVSLEAPGRPDDACEFIGEGDGSFVVTTSFLKIERPNAQPIERRAPTLSGSCCDENGSGAMYWQSSQIRIALLTDSFETSALAGGVFA